MKKNVQQIINRDEMKPSLYTSSVGYSCILRKNGLTPLLFALIIFMVLLSYFHGEDLAEVLGQFGLPDSTQPTVRLVQKKKVKLPFLIGEISNGESCDVFKGKWMRDETTRPFYDESDCPYIQPQFTCQKKGKPDKEYQYWRWQPYGCDLPRFNATVMLETLRGKRMLYVGDSINRGQFTSMVCLLQSVIPSHAKSFTQNGSLTTFTAMEYDALIEFYWAPFLLESNADNAQLHRITDRVIRKDSINTHGNYWKGRDIIVFNTYLWWMTGLKMKILEGSFVDKEKNIVEISTEDAYSMSITSMLAWVRNNMDLSKTRIFFTSMSPVHAKSHDWGEQPGGNCYNQTTMIKDLNYWGSDCRKSIMRVITDILHKHEEEIPVTFLNITQLSSYRKDAHTTIYKKNWNPVTPEQLANPVTAVRYSDCVHWCLPGLQDIWNELLFTKLFYS